jgi:formylglycine-generating enzyme required for sulfatase activity
VEWFRKAADKGCVNAQNQLGLMYDKGNGVTKDVYEATNWYRKAAEQGYVHGQFNLGFNYEHGEGVDKNIDKAKEWYGKAAAQGHEKAKERLEKLQKEDPEPNEPLTSFSNSRVTITVKGVPFTMKPVEGGTFRMGSNNSEADGDEQPVHSVSIGSFYMGETEVTQALWKAVMGTTVREQRDKADPLWKIRGEGDDYPMYYVSYDEIVNEFLPRLNQLTGRKFRLPTEAEWEYAARGGNQSKGYKCAGSSTIGNVAWYVDNSDQQTHCVKAKESNELGLYDMSGNVDEWCKDWYDSSYYASSSSSNPTGPSTGSKRVCRGGSWNSGEKSCRVSHRSYNSSDARKSICGFRLALNE